MVGLRRTGLGGGTEEDVCVESDDEIVDSQSLSLSLSP